MLWRASATETSGFSVGTAEGFPPFTVLNNSGRGPSGCGTEWETKPEVVGPGKMVLTTYPGDEMVYYTSSRASAAYVAGVVALMRQAVPGADAETIKQALLTRPMTRTSPVTTTSPVEASSMPMRPYWRSWPSWVRLAEP